MLKELRYRKSKEEWKNEKREEGQASSGDV
jgi:hypothetical protein